MSIDKVSGIAFSSIDRIGRVRSTDIEKVSGITTSYVLDDFSGAVAAYSLRQLSSTATTAISVENASGTIQDIGFDSNGRIDASALTAHCGNSYGRVSKWWDQSGNGNHMEQSTAASRPRIVDTSGNIVTTTDNSIKALDFYGNSTARWLSDTFSSNNGDHFVISYVGEFRTVTEGQQIVSQWTSSTSTQTFSANVLGASSKLRLAARYSTSSNHLGRVDTSATVAADTEYVVVGYMSASPYEGDIDVNGDTAHTSTGFPSTGNLRSASAGITIGRRHDNGAAQYQGYLAEVIIWSAGTLPNRNNIMTDTKSFYGIT